MCFLMLDRSVGLKKKKVTVSLGIGGPGTLIYCQKCSSLVSVFPLYAVTMLIFQIKRIISSEKWFSYVVTFFFFLKMPKIWVDRTTLNGEKKEDGLKAKSLRTIIKI